MALPKSTGKTTGKTVVRPGRVKFRDLDKEEQRARIDRAERAGRMTSAKAAAAREYWDLPSKEAVVWAAENQWEPVPPTRPKPDKKPQKSKSFSEAVAANAPRPYRRSGLPGARSSEFRLGRAYNWAIGAPVRPEAQRMLARTRTPERTRQRAEMLTAPRTGPREYGGSWGSLDPRENLNALRTAAAGLLGYTGERDITSFDPRKNLASIANAVDVVGDIGEASLRAAPGQARRAAGSFVERMRESALGGPTDLGTKEERQRRMAEGILAQNRDPVGRILKEAAGPTLVESIATGKLPEGRGGKGMLLLEAAGVFPVGKLGRGVVEGIKAAQAVERGAKAGVIADAVGKSLGGEMAITTAAKAAGRGTKKAVAKVAARPPAVLNVPERAAAHAAIDATGDRVTANAAKADLDDRIQAATRGLKGADRKAAVREAYREVQEAVEADLRGGAAATRVSRVEGPLPLDEGLVDVSEYAKTGLSGSDIAKVDMRGITEGVDMGVFREEGVQKLIPRLTRLLQAGEGGRLWYERSAKAILRFAGGDVDLAKKYAQVVAVMSAQRNPFENIELATEALRQLQVGKRAPVISKGKKIGESSVTVGTGPQRVKVQQIMDGKEWAGRKTDRFYRNMLEDIDPDEYARLYGEGNEVTNDIWQARLFGLKTDHPTPREYEALEQLTRNIADALGWKPKQVQAALWGPIRVEAGVGSKAMTIEEGMLDFSHALLRESAQLPVEPGPGIRSKIGGALGAYRALSPASKGEFDTAMNEALGKFLRDSGALAVIGEREAVTSAGTIVLMPTKMTGKGVLGPRSREALDAVTTMIGDAAGHDSASWFRPKHIKNVAKGRQNGTHVAGLGRKLTEGEEAKVRFLLEKRLGGPVQLPPGPDGSFYVLNFSKRTKNAQFQDIVDDVLSGVLRDADVETRGFYFRGKNHMRRADGSYPNQRTAWAGRPAVQRSLDELRTSIGQLHQRHLGVPGPDPTPRRIRGYEQPGEPGVLAGRTAVGAPTGPQEFRAMEEAVPQGQREVSPSARGMEEEPLPALTGKERTNALARRRRLLKKVNPTEDEEMRLRALEQQLGIGGGPRLAMDQPISTEELQTILKRTKKRPRMTAAMKAAAADPNQIHLFGEDLQPTRILPEDVESQLREMLRAQEAGEPMPRATPEEREAAKRGRRVVEAEDPETAKLLDDLGYGEGDSSMEALRKQVKDARAKTRKPRAKTGKRQRPGQMELEPRKPGRAPAPRQEGPQEAPGPPRKPGRARAPRQEGPQEAPVATARKPGRTQTKGFREAMGPEASATRRVRRHKPTGTARQQRRAVRRGERREAPPLVRQYNPRQPITVRTPDRVSERPDAKVFLDRLPKLRYGRFTDLNQEGLDAVFETIATAPNLTERERQTAISVLLDALGGKRSGGQIVATRAGQRGRGRVLNKEGQRILRKAFGEHGDNVVEAIRESTPVWAHARNAGRELYNLPRSLMSTFDLSIPLRQGLLIATTHPRLFTRNFIKMHRTFGEAGYNDSMNRLASSPDYQQMVDDGVDFADLGTLSQREEYAYGTWAERAPRAVGGGIVRTSSRAAASFLNNARADYYRMLMRDFEAPNGALSKMTRDIREAALERGIRDEEVIQRQIDGAVRQFRKDVATTVNTATGRGDLGKLAGAAEGLSGILFSPRLLASRFNVLDPRFYYRASPGVRKERLRMLLSTIAGMSGFLAIMSQVPGVDVEFDPRSSDFGKIRIGKQRIDVMGGFQQPIVALIRMFKAQSKSPSSGEVTDLGTYGHAVSDVAKNFARSKLSPVAGTIWDAVERKDFKGDPVRWTGTKEIAGRKIPWSPELLDSVTPMLLGDLWEISHEEGWEQALATAPFGVYGFGMNAFEAPSQPTEEEEEEEVKQPF